ncbi:entericidin A/B family lipoprotein [Paraglaciecola aestuariivivens]
MWLSKMSTKLKCVLMSVFLMLTLGACATIEGAGKDLEAAGEAVQDAADG